MSSVCLQHQGGHQLANQLYAIVVTVGWSAFATYVILWAVDMAGEILSSLFTPSSPQTRH